MSWKDLLRTICLLLGLAPFAIAQNIERQPQDEKLTQLAQAGREALNAKNYETAVSSFQQVIAAKPDWPRAHYYLGLAYQRWSRYDEALAAYEQASRVEPHDLVSQYGRGITYLAQKNYAQAVAQYRWLKEAEQKVREKNEAPPAVQPPAGEKVIQSAKNTPARTAVLGGLAGDELATAYAS